jgi:hypothetical protein
MKKITLEISDEVFKELKSGIWVRGLSDALFGVQNEFVMKLIVAIEKDQEVLVVEFKKGGENNDRAKA